MFHCRGKAVNMETDCTARLNIKKKKSNLIYWGVCPDTGELLSIEEVERGLACNCVCAACNERLVAKKGEENTHHFAHEHNNDCYYGAEIAIYRALYDKLNKKKQFYIPEAILKFNSGKKPETVGRAQNIELISVEFRYDLGTYPPELLCYKDNRCFRLVLNFESYFNETDYMRLEEHGKQKGISVMKIDVDNLAHTMTDVEISNLMDCQDGKAWIYSQTVELYDTKYKNKAVKIEKWEGRYLCPAQKAKYHNVFSVVKAHCLNCQYCYDIRAEEFCLAKSCINHVADFRKSEAELQETFNSENEIQPIKKISEFQCPKCNAPLVKRKGPKGVFAGCSNYPKCRGSRNVEPISEQVIIENKRHPLRDER